MVWPASGVPRKRAKMLSQEPSTERQARVSSFAQRARARCIEIGGAAGTASDTLIAAAEGVEGGASAGYYAYSEGGSPSIVATFAATGAADGYRADGFFARNSPYQGYASAIGRGFGIISAVKP